ncbi:hypothetical protein PAA26_04510 [Methanomassiliicoccaceae archaeon COG_1]|nr:hypothetical protein [Methanomassiliicoccaceae archaeon COG_1]
MRLVIRSRDVLGKKHAIDVLLEISEHPGRIQAELADKRNPASGSRRARLADLVDAGYVRAKSVKRAQPSIAYSLTPEGERICGLLREIEDGESTGKTRGRVEVKPRRPKGEHDDVPIYRRKDSEIYRCNRAVEEMKHPGRRERREMEARHASHETKDDEWWNVMVDGFCTEGYATEEDAIEEAEYELGTGSDEVIIEHVHIDHENEILVRDAEGRWVIDPNPDRWFAGVRTNIRP